MHFVERILGFAPDGGSGTLEAALLLVPLVVLLLLFFKRRKSPVRRLSGGDSPLE